MRSLPDREMALASDSVRSPAVPPATVAVVVPVRNRRDLTLRCLGACHRQTYEPLQVIVVDSNSTDDTVNAVRLAYPAVEILAATDRDFWAGATNLGVCRALECGAEWVLTLNDDALIESDHVARLVDLATRHDCRILGSQINYLSDPRLVWSLGTSTRWGTAQFLSLNQHGQQSERGASPVGKAELLRVDALAGNGVLVHRSVFQAIGLYQSRILPHYHADSELVMRAVAAGISAWVTPRVVVLNDFSPDQKRLRLKTPSGLWRTFCHPKSHLYLPALVYIFWRYCPRREKLSTTLFLLGRLFKLGL